MVELTLQMLEAYSCITQDLVRKTTATLDISTEFNIGSLGIEGLKDIKET